MANTKQEIINANKRNLVAEINKLEGLLEDPELHYDGKVFDNATLEMLDIETVKRQLSDLRNLHTQAFQDPNNQ